MKEKVSLNIILPKDICEKMSCREDFVITLGDAIIERLIQERIWTEVDSWPYEESSLDETADCLNSNQHCTSVESLHNRIEELENAIRKHCNNVWGDDYGPVLHDEDAELYKLVGTKKPIN